jgi:glycosyltransferase involved in cell wall biosynthesis
METADQHYFIATGIMNNPYLTIIIPTLQAERTLPDALNSLVSQQYSDFEVLIMDSMSRDRTLAIAEAFVKNDGRVRVFSEPDKGIYDAMNKGIEKARGQWILFLGSDDRLQDKEALAFFAALPDPGAFDMVYGNVVSPSYKGVYDGPFSFPKLLSRNMPHQAIFYRKSLFELIGGYTIRYRGHADWEFNIRCFSDNRVRIRYIDRIIAYFGADGVSSRHDIPFIKERLLPERLRLLNATPHSLRSLKTFDEWWRLLRNACIRDTDSLETSAAGQRVPNPVFSMLRWQRKMPTGFLQNGLFSKSLMFINYLRNFLTGSL